LFFKHKRRLLLAVITAIAAACARALRRRCLRGEASESPVRIVSSASPATGHLVSAKGSNAEVSSTLEDSLHLPVSQNGKSHLWPMLCCHRRKDLHTNGDHHALHKGPVADVALPDKWCWRRRKDPVLLPIQSAAEAAAKFRETLPVPEEQCVEKATGSAATTEAGQPDFTGLWLAMRVEGDIARFLIEIGAPWAMRRLSKFYDYGVGKLQCVIEQSGDDMVMEDVLSSQMSTKSTFQIGAGVQACRELFVDPTWDDSRAQTLRIAVQLPDGSEKYTKFVYLQGQELLIERRAPSGLSATLYFERQALPKNDHPQQKIENF